MITTMKTPKNFILKIGIGLFCIAVIIFLYVCVSVGLTPFPAGDYIQGNQAFITFLIVIGSGIVATPFLLSLLVLAFVAYTKRQIAAALFLLGENIYFILGFIQHPFGINLIGNCSSCLNTWWPSVAQGYIGLLTISSLIFAFPIYDRMKKQEPLLAATVLGVGIVASCIAFLWCMLLLQSIN